MFFAGCSVSERYVNPLFEVFDGGDLVLSSYKDIEKDLTLIRVYFEDKSSESLAVEALKSALQVLNLDIQVITGEIPDDDWKFAYRRHFKIEKIGSRLVTVPEWELDNYVVEEGRVGVVLDPGLAFGTGKHETTRTCLEYIEELSSLLGPQATMIDMGSGSGILSIAAAKLGYSNVCGFDIDPEAVQASKENAERNSVAVEYTRYALGKPNIKAPNERYDLVVANILGPLLIRFAAEIDLYVKSHLVISGILTEVYEEVLAAFTSLGYKEVSRKTSGEWSTGLLTR